MLIYCMKEKRALSPLAVMLGVVVLVEIEDDITMTLCEGDGEIDAETD